jgi:hypothetical protein
MHGQEDAGYTVILLYYNRQINENRNGELRRSYEELKNDEQ